MMKARMKALAAVALLLLAGCSSLTSGYVIGKQHTDAYDWMDMQCFSYNDKGMCTMRVPIWHHVPESWEICVKLDDTQDWWSVDEPTFHRTKVGDWVERNPS